MFKAKKFLQVILLNLDPFNSPHILYIHICTCSGSDTPLTDKNLAQLMSILAPAANRWRQIGIQFGIPLSKLDSFRNEHHSDMDCLSETINYWLRNSENCTIQSVNRVLESPSVDRRDLKQ